MGTANLPDLPACTCNFDEMVLLVDDEPFNHMAMAQLIEMYSNNLLKAKSVFNGKEALEFVDKRLKCKAHLRFKLIILDINMPGMNGHEVN